MFLKEFIKNLKLTFHFSFFFKMNLIFYISVCNIFQLMTFFYNFMSNWVYFKTIHSVPFLPVSILPTSRNVARQ